MRLICSAKQDAWHHFLLVRFPNVLLHVEVRSLTLGPACKWCCSSLGCSGLPFFLSVFVDATLTRQLIFKGLSLDTFDDFIFSYIIFADT